MTQKIFMNRRSFIQSGAATAAITGLGVSAQAADKKIDKSKILNYKPGMPYRMLGDTGLMISAISMGGLVNEPGIHDYAIDNGVNLVHISNSYINGRSIVELGKVLKTRRKDVYVALKDNFFNRKDYETEDYSKLDKWLKVLNCDYVDFFMYNRHDEKSAGDPLIKKSFEKLKAAGKVRFCGHTSHDKNLKASGSALASGMFSMLNPRLDQKNLQVLDSVLRDAHAKKVGVMAMKSMSGLKSLDQQCMYIKKMLKNPAVTTVLKGIGSFEMFDAYKKAAGEALTASEDMQLYRYAMNNRSTHCMACSECKDACPDNIEIATVLRCKDYYVEEQHDMQTAMETYHELSPSQRLSSKCGECHECEKACPNDINIVERLQSANQLFA
jgi:uncharacterized protein